MRLIDADALIQKRNHAKNYSPDMYVIGQGYVMDAPTIDAVPMVRGEWVGFDYEYWGEVGTAYACSECDDKTTVKTNYCPNCGAKMESEGST